MTMTITEQGFRVTQLPLPVEHERANEPPPAEVPRAERHRRRWHGSSLVVIVAAAVIVAFCGFFGGRVSRNGELATAHHQTDIAQVSAQSAQRDAANARADASSARADASQAQSAVTTCRQAVNAGNEGFGIVYLWLDAMSRGDFVTANGYASALGPTMTQWRSEAAACGGTNASNVSTAR